MTAATTPRPPDATLSVTKAARMLGVHPNTVRAWSDAGRLRYYRINQRGDRRYRLGDLQRFLAAAEHTSADAAVSATTGAPSRRPQRATTDSLTSPELLSDARRRSDLAILDLIARVGLESGD
ncbi:MAG: helix-turn-helix domain-containing protein, partial [Chloroflexota bacterium]